MERCILGRNQRKLPYASLYRTLPNSTPVYCLACKNHFLHDTLIVYVDAYKLSARKRRETARNFEKKVQELRKRKTTSF